MSQSCSHSYLSCPRGERRFRWSVRSFNNGETVYRVLSCPYSAKMDLNSGVGIMKPGHRRHQSRNTRNSGSQSAALADIEYINIVTTRSVAQTRKKTFRYGKRFETVTTSLTAVTRPVVYREVVVAIRRAATQQRGRRTVSARVRLNSYSSPRVILYRIVNM